MKAKLRIISAVIGGTVMAAALMGGMESLGIRNVPDISVSAAKAEKVYDGKASLSVNKGIRCDAGETVSVPVYMSLDKSASPQSLYKLSFNVSYDDTALELTGVTKGAGLKGGMYGRSGDTVMFMALKGSMTVTAGKPICTLKFKVKDDAQGICQIKLRDHTGGDSPVQVIHTHSKKEGNKYFNTSVSNGSVAVGEIGALGEVTGVTADNTGLVTWEPAENAVYYRVVKVIDDKPMAGGIVTETSYQLASVPDMDFPVYVTAYDVDGKTVNSEKVMIYNSKPLGKVENISVDSSGMVTWDEAENAVSYTVTRVFNGKSATSSRTKNTYYQFKSVPAGDYEVYITSYDVHDNLYVSDVYKVTSDTVIKKATEITGLKADRDGSVTWDEAEGAVSYKVTKVYKGNSSSSYKITDNSYTFLKVPEGEFEVYVTAFFADETTLVSDRVTVKAEEKTEEPEEPSVPEDTNALGEINEISVDDNGTITWEGLKNAVYYTVTIKCNGEEKISNKLTETSYIPDPVPDTDYEFIVTAYDAEGNSVQSDPNEITFD